MLLQSHNGVIRLLPALPTAWPDGEVTGLVARGAVTVDIRWAGGKATQVRLASKLGGTFRVRPPKGQRGIAVLDGRKRLAVQPAGSGDDVTIAIAPRKAVRLELSP
jgi:alpha-L-fucosidase 2